MEEKGYTESGYKQTCHKQHQAHPDCFRGYILQRYHPHIQNKAIDEYCDKGKQICHTESTQNQHGCDQQYCLQYIFRHSEGKPCSPFGNKAVHYIGRCHNHGYAKIRAFHQSYTEGEKNQSQNISDNRNYGCFFHIYLSKSNKKLRRLI